MKLIQVLITGFNVLANFSVGDTVFSLTDATDTSYSLSSSFVEIIDGTRLYYAKVRVGDDTSLTNTRKYGDCAVIVSYPSGGIDTLTIYTTDVCISFDFQFLQLIDGNIDLVASNKLLSKSRRNLNCGIL